MILQENVPFRLQGHYNPLGKYPASVLPVGEYNGDRVILYLLGDCSTEVLSYEEDQEGHLPGFVKYDHHKLKKFSKFEYNHNRLFAFDEDEVEIYEASREVEYYRKVLREREISKREPFIALAMAKDCEDRHLVVQALEECLKILEKRKLGENKDSLLQWYSLKRSQIGDWLPVDPFQKKKLALRTWIR